MPRRHYALTTGELDRSDLSAIAELLEPMCDLRNRTSSR